MKLLFTNDLKSVMARHNVTQEVLAGFLHIDVRKLRKIIKGEAYARINEAQAIVIFFNTIQKHRVYTLDEIFICNQEE